LVLHRGWIGGRDVLKDNQADVLVHLAEASDKESKVKARAFFQFPYKKTMRIELVHELVQESFQNKCGRESISKFGMSMDDHSGDTCDDNKKEGDGEKEGCNESNEGSSCNRGEGCGKKKGCDES
jgi:hypothetical protein